MKISYGIVAILLLLSGIYIVANIDTVKNAATVNVDAQLPLPTNYVVDTGHVLSTDQLQTLSKKLKNTDNEKHQFGVAIIPTLGSLTVEQYSIALAEAWKVGSMDTDNGVIIVIATEDRKVRIEVGKGLEGSIPDSVAGEIIRNDMTPALKAGQWYDAVVAGIDALSARTQ